METNTTLNKVETTPHWNKVAKRQITRLATSFEEVQALLQVPVEVQEKVLSYLKEIERLLTPYQQKLPSKRKQFKAIKVNEVHVSILKFLVGVKFASTSQIGKYVPCEKAVDRLRELEEGGLVKSYRYQVDKGQASEKCWWLVYRGAKLLKKEYQFKARYDARLSSYPPSEERVKLRGMELELSCQVKAAGWELLVPQIFNKENPKPEGQLTPQARQLSIALDLLERREIQEARKRGENINARIVAYKGKKHLEDVPVHSNHYVAYHPQSEDAIVLILCPLDATGRFWEMRLKEYGLLSFRLPVCGIFYEAGQATAWIQPLNESGIRAVTINRLKELFLP